jgi:hypothetical protein
MRIGRTFTALIALLALFVGVAHAQQAPSRWPMQIALPDGRTLLVFQPQLDNFTGDQLQSRAAVQLNIPGQAQPAYGAVWLQARVATDRSAGTVQIIQVAVTQAQFPTLDPQSSQGIGDAIAQTLTNNPATLSLNQLNAMLQVVQQQNAEVADIQTAPPTIIFMDHPAVKVQFDGQPIFEHVANSNLLRCANTPFFIVLDNGTYFLKGAGRWFYTSNPLGPYRLTPSVPLEVSDLANQSGYTDPQQPISDAEAAALEIVTATDPTELVWTDGPAQYTPIADTDLLYMTNTDSDVFITADGSENFILLSGRWFVGPTQNGPWTFVPPNQLPPDFKNIPPDSAKADVLAFVPGTQQAASALANQYIPQTAAIDRTNFEQPPVSYDGDPNFQPVQGVDCSYAVNTSYSVIQCSGAYYCCYNAVWYTCATPTGQWGLCTQVPGVIYTIPPSCPIYPVRYCYIYGQTPQVIYCGYTPGYVGSFAYDGVVVYGTGYRYDPWKGQRYIPRPTTYGFAAYYDPGSGHWGFGFALATGGGALWVGDSSKQPERHSTWFGYGGYRPSVLPHDFHPVARSVEHPVTPPRDLYARDLYQNRKDVRPEYTPPPRQDNYHSAAPEQRPVVQPNPPASHDDLYTDEHGNVFRNTPQGWEQQKDNQWKPAPEAPKEPQHTEPQNDKVQHDEPVHTEPQPQKPEDHPEAKPTPEPKNNGGSDIDRLNRDKTARQQGSPPPEQSPKEAPPEDRKTKP